MRLQLKVNVLWRSLSKQRVAGRAHHYHTILQLPWSRRHAQSHGTTPSPHIPNAIYSKNAQHSPNNIIQRITTHNAITSNGTPPAFIVDVVSHEFVKGVGSGSGVRFCGGSSGWHSIGQLPIKMGKKKVIIITPSFTRHSHVMVMKVMAFVMMTPFIGLL